MHISAKITSVSSSHGATWPQDASEPGVFRASKWLYLETRIGTNIGVQASVSDTHVALRRA